MDLYNASSPMGEEPEAIELTLEQYEEAKAHYAEIIAHGQAARELPEHPGFKTFIMEGYLTNEVHRLAELIASGRLTNEKTLKDCHRQLDSIADFRNYMKNILEQANMAADELAGLEEARDLAIAEAEAQE